MFLSEPKRTPLGDLRKPNAPLGVKVAGGVLFRARLSRGDGDGDDGDKGDGMSDDDDGLVWCALAVRGGLTTAVVGASRSDAGEGGEEEGGYVYNE
ncbi:hypothetical protein Tco_0684014 [Tanacetum coccineum]